LRRVVTERLTAARSAVTADDDVAPITVEALPGHVWHRLWSSDCVDAPGDQPSSTHFPPPGGLRFNIFTVPPERDAVGELSAEEQEELERKLPGRGQHMQDGASGMHATATLDLVYVAQGEISLALDGGDEIELRAGDSVVQQSAMHAWRNRGDRPCVLVIVMVGTQAAD
jgi:mannose-6-phosphate isomerase-like protein (cupin superfamily)